MRQQNVSCTRYKRQSVVVKYKTSITSHVLNFVPFASHFVLVGNSPNPLSVCFSRLWGFRPPFSVDTQLR